MKLSERWSNVETIAPVPASAAGLSLAASDSIVHAAWVEDGTLRHSRRRAEGWTAPGLLHRGDQPSLAASPDGRIHCLFRCDFAGTSRILHTSWDGTGWCLPRGVSHPASNCTQPVLAVGPDGALHAAWTDNGGAFPGVCYGKSHDGIWSSLPIPGGRGRSPALAVGGDGQVFVAWHDRLGGTLLLQTFCSTLKGNAWSPATQVSTDLTSHAFGPAVSAIGRDRCHVVWRQQRKEVFIVMHSARKDSVWCDPGQLSPMGSDCLNGHCAAGPGSSLVCSWLTGRAITVRMHSRGDEASWQNAEDVLTDASDLAEMALSLDSSGRAHLVFLTMADSGSTLMYTRVIAAL